MSKRLADVKNLNMHSSSEEKIIYRDTMANKDEISREDVGS